MILRIYLLVLIGLKSLRDWKVVSRGQYYSSVRFIDLHNRYSNTLLVVLNNRLLLQREEANFQGGDGGDGWQGSFDHKKSSNFSMSHHFSNADDIIIDIGKQTDNGSPFEMVSSHYFPPSVQD